MGRLAGARVFLVGLALALLAASGMQGEDVRAQPAPPTRTPTPTPTPTPQPMPDLRIAAGSISFEPPSVAAGEQITVSLIVQNVGTDNAPASVTAYYLSLVDNANDNLDKAVVLEDGKQPTGAVARDSRLPLSKILVRIPATTAPGSYFVEACANDTQRFKERLDSNNCSFSRAQLRVQPPATATFTPTATATATRTLSPTATFTPTATATATPSPTVTATVTPPATPSPEPTATAPVGATPTFTATVEAATPPATPTPTDASTETPTPTPTPSPSPIPPVGVVTTAPTRPTTTPTSTATATLTPTATATRTVTPTPPPIGPSRPPTSPAVGWLIGTLAVLAGMVLADRFLPEPPLTAPFGRPISTGFARPGRPFSPLDPLQPLLPGSPYLFWVELGDVSNVPGPATQRDPVPLAVTLFSYPGELQIDRRQDLGQIVLRPDGSAVVAAPVGLPTRDLVAAGGPARVYFPIRTPERAGPSRLRCSLYCRQVLVQSHVVTTRVAPVPVALVLSVRAFGARLWRKLARQSRGPSSEIDFTLAPRLDPTHLGQLRPHRLSIMVNENPNGTHSFRFFGAWDLRGDATFDGHEIQPFIKLARGVLCRVTWGAETPWDERLAYLYERAGRPQQLADDLIQMAVRGYRLYDAIIDRLAGSRDKADEFRERMRQTGRVQIVHKRTPRFILPAALLYDRPLDTSSGVTRRLCQTFVRVVYSGGSLAASPCFKGRCPEYGDLASVCPSGFWGYRHQLGMPLSVDDGQERLDATAAYDAPIELTVDGEPRVVVGVSTDRAFRLRPEHELELRKIWPGPGWHYAPNRALLLGHLRDVKPHLVYLYCHGGLQDGLPFLQVGDENEPGITRDNLRAAQIRWRSPRPLVFLNGCRTTAVEPEVAFDFVSGFVYAGAAGVIGTEITIFEPLARVFAEECMRRFSQRLEIGESVRATRLALLEEANPLGLVYVPYVQADLHLSPVPLAPFVLPTDDPLPDVVPTDRERRGSGR